MFEEGRENFTRDWQDYKNGFGDLNGEFWFGNDFLHSLTTSQNMRLRVELESFYGQTAWAEYDEFRLGIISVMSGNCNYIEPGLTGRMRTTVSGWEVTRVTPVTACPPTTGTSSPQWTGTMTGLPSVVPVLQLTVEDGGSTGWLPVSLLREMIITNPV